MHKFSLNFPRDSVVRSLL